MHVSGYLASHLQHRSYEALLSHCHRPDALLHLVGWFNRFGLFADTTDSTYRSDPTAYKGLHAERLSRLALWHLLKQIFYYEPIFKACCERVGRSFELLAGIPLVMGALRIRIGDHVRMSGLTTFVASKMVQDPVLEIGSRTTIGHETTICVGRGVHIGLDVTIGNGVSILAEDSHPLDPVARAQNGPPCLEDLEEVWIDDGAVVGDRSILLKGVRIGPGAVVLPGAVVTKDVPAHTVVLGNPARVVEAGETPERWAEQGGRPPKVRHGGG